MRCCRVLHHVQDLGAKGEAAYCHHPRYPPYQDTGSWQRFTFCFPGCQGHVGERAHPSHAAVVAKRFQVCGCVVLATSLVSTWFVETTQQDSEPAVFAATAVALARMGVPGAPRLHSASLGFRQKYKGKAFGTLGQAEALAKELAEDRSELEQQVKSDVSPCIFQRHHPIFWRWFAKHWAVCQTGKQQSLTCQH